MTATYRQPSQPTTNLQSTTAPFSTRRGGISQTYKGVAGNSASDSKRPDDTLTRRANGCRVSNVVVHHQPVPRLGRSCPRSRHTGGNRPHPTPFCPQPHCTTQIEAAAIQVKFTVVGATLFPWLIVTRFERVKGCRYILRWS